MRERPNGHIEATPKDIKLQEIEFTGGRKDGWQVNVYRPDGTRFSRKLATTAQIIAGDLYASLNFGEPSVAYTLPKTGEVDILRVEGTARLVAGFPAGTKATKSTRPDGTTRIYPVYPRRIK